MGRELMYNPFWSLHAAQKLGADPEYNLWPDQYRWAVSRRSKVEKFKNVKNKYEKYFSEKPGK